MKLPTLSLLCAATAALLPFAPLSAQTSGAPDATAPAAPKHPMMSVDDQLALMKKDLGLSDDQVAKLKPVFEERKAAVDAISQDKSLSPAEKKAKIAAGRNDTKKKVADVLTLEQKMKMKALRDAHAKDKGSKAGN